MVFPSEIHSFNKPYESRKAPTHHCNKCAIFATNLNINDESALYRLSRIDFNYVRIPVISWHLSMFNGWEPACGYSVEWIQGHEQQLSNGRTYSAKLSRLLLKCFQNFGMIWKHMRCVQKMPNHGTKTRCTSWRPSFFRATISIHRQTNINTFRPDVNRKHLSNTSTIQ